MTETYTPAPGSYAAEILAVDGYKFNEYDTVRNIVPAAFQLGRRQRETWYDKLQNPQRARANVLMAQGYTAATAISSVR